ncbi:hypothetical protein BGZ61DRAFT_504150 [Ilyonectria robusta]|uniref:uncharacterized protein n=1 Tax=Ilyonectria robusta TaxID=1079257 RepID=UPI001E8EA58F|nr:uncharacterized protein BGZ61DRAFT_504150 [Ilyonectria robusta]KAH8734057.1 hypothetical protein BGZ61DRAFT_504150 [Ilyonectria robusta]
MTSPTMEAQLPRPASREGFQIAIFCALPLEADAVEALFDVYWDDEDPPFDKAPGDPNAYSTGVIGRHNVVLVRMPGMGKTNAAIVANNCRTSFSSIKLALVVGVCGVVPFGHRGEEIILGDVVISNGVIQYDLGRQLPGGLVRKATVLDSLGRPNLEIRAVLAKLEGLRARKLLATKMTDYLDILRIEPSLGAQHPGPTHDILFEASYDHIGDKEPCEKVGCSGKLVTRHRLETGQGNPKPAVHIGLIASGDSVMKSGKHRDDIAARDGVIAFEMEGAGIWDTFPSVVIKGACDYADSHKSKSLQPYAAATAAACMKAFLSHWAPSIPATPSGPAIVMPIRTATAPDIQEQQMILPVKYIVPYTSNPDFVGRAEILNKLKDRFGDTQQTGATSQARVSLYGLGGVGKTQIALAHVFWLQETCPQTSVFWVHASTTERFRQAYGSIAKECHIPGHNDPKADVLMLVKSWLEKKNHGKWLMVIDNADDAQLFSSQPAGTATTNEPKNKQNLARYLPECAHGAILITTRNKQVGVRLTKGQQPIEVLCMDKNESEHLLRAKLSDTTAASDDLLMLADRLENLPLALAQGAAYIQETSITVAKYIQLLDGSETNMIDLLSKEFETIGRDSDALQPVAQTWILSFQQIEQQNVFAGELLSFMCLLDRQDIPAQFLSHYSEQDRNGGPRSDMELTEALGILKAFSFLTENNIGNFDMHRLVQLVTRKWLNGRGTITRFKSEALQTVSHIYPDGNIFENQTQCAMFLSHANSVLRLDGVGSRDDDDAKATLLNCIAGYFSFGGQWSDAEKLNIEAVEIRKEIWGEDHPKTLKSMIGLALTNWKQGRWEEAEKLQVYVMETCKLKLGADHPNTLTSMINLASTNWKQGRWEEAEKLEVYAMEACKLKLGADHPNTLTSMINLASTNWKQGRWEEAEKLQVYVMEICKLKLGADHPNTLANHPNTLASMGNLAMTCWEQGRLEEAEKLEVYVMETSKAKLGADHPDTLISMANLAYTWKSLERFSEATNLMRECVHIRQTKLGLNHPDTQLAISTLENGRVETM